MSSSSAPLDVMPIRVQLAAAERPGHGKLGAFLYLFALAAALIFPLVSRNFLVFQVTLVMAYAIAIMGLNILTGFNGQFSLGHGAFYAIGAYATAILTERYGVPYGLAIPIAAVLSFTAGALFGLPALRLGGLYLALATFALAVATPQILKLSPLEGLTGGVQGLTVSKPDAPLGLPLNQDQWLYYVTAVITVLLMVCARNLVRSRSGRAMMAIRDNPIAARSMGINVSLYKTLAFAVSAFYAGVAGALGAIAVQFVAPDSFTFFLSVTLLVGLVVGGVGWIPGALFGAAFVMFAPHVAEQFSKGLSGALYGVILIALIYLLPAGAGGLVGRAKRALRTRRLADLPQLASDNPLDLEQGQDRFPAKTQNPHPECRT